MANRRGLSTERVRELAKEGAGALLKRLRVEVAAIEKTFPELALPQRRQTLGRSIKSAKKRARQISVSARKEASKRMRKYGAERRKAFAAAKK